MSQASSAKMLRQPMAGFSDLLYFQYYCTALTVGSVSIIARLFTSSKKEELVVRLILRCLVRVFRIILGWQVSAFRPDRKGFNVPVQLKSLTITLLRIYSIGLVFNYMLINTNGILRACKMVSRSLWTMSLVSILNIILIYFLALRTPLGYQGLLLLLRSVYLLEAS